LRKAANPRSGTSSIALEGLAGAHACLIDAHCHLDDPRLEGQWPVLWQRARRAGIVGCILAGTHEASWQRSSALARSTEGLWPTYGVHPWWAECAEAETIWLDVLRQSLTESAWVRPIGIGEIGLDYARARTEAARAQQRAVFRAQLALAREAGLPVVLHVVRAHAALLHILDADGIATCGGMVHGFTGDREQARDYVSRGLVLSFGSAVTYPGRRKLVEAVGSVPRHAFVIESDAPHQPPSGRQGLNEPAWLWEIVRAVAATRDVPPQVVAEESVATTVRLFGLPAWSPT